MPQLIEAIFMFKNYLYVGRQEPEWYMVVLVKSHNMEWGVKVFAYSRVDSIL